MSKHLDNKVIAKCLDREHTPINPHSQRLLTAEARAAGKLAKAQPKKPDKTEQKKQEKLAQTKRKKTEKEKEEASGVPRTVYAMAKKEFMAQDWFLVQ